MKILWKNYDLNCKLWKALFTNVLSWNGWNVPTFQLVFIATGIYWNLIKFPFYILSMYTTVLFMVNGHRQHQNFLYYQGYHGKITYLKPFWWKIKFCFKNWCKIDWVMIWKQFNNLQIKIKILFSYFMMAINDIYLYEIICSYYGLLM